MEKYKRTTAKNGRVMYHKFDTEKKRYILHSESKIPLRVREVWDQEGDVEVEYIPSQDDQTTPPVETLAEPTPDDRSLDQVPEGTDVCLVCGNPAETQRYVNGSIVNLCKEHGAMTLGSVAEAMRQKSQSGA